MSDHDIVHCGLNYKNPLSKASPRSPTELRKFDTLNFNKPDWDPIDNKFSLVDWEEKFSTASVEESQTIFEDTVFEICAAHTPVKGPKSSEDRKPYLTKHRRILIRRKKKLSAKINSFKEKGCKQVLIDKLYETKFNLELQIRDQIQAERNQLELEAILKIRENPKAFFTYAKKFQKTKEGIGPLRDGDGGLQSDPKVISELLKTQYSKAFSSPKKEYPPLANRSPKKGKKFSLEDITFFEEDIITAIASMGTYSAVGPDKFPAIILKKCSKTLASPLASMLRSSLDLGIIPTAYKKQSIVPIYKKGNRDNPANYRPVSLTSHIIKVFERVIRSKMVEYLETNKLLNKNQHGFRKGRNCLSQLLDHYDELLNTVSNSSNADVIYLDYSKAFDKVDHHILLQKLERIGITGKLYRWLECFLTDRVQQVIVDGVSSSFAIVISGVPQGTVLGPLLFIIFVDDMSEVVKHSILKLFADDSKLSKAIRSMLDQILLQEDVNAILLWAKDNNMELNEEKFQLIQHGKISHLKPTTSEIYKTSQGTSLNPTDVVVDLGVTINEGLNWKSHVETTSLKARQFAGWILRTFKSRHKDLMMTLYNSFVRSRLEYCCPLWSPYLVQDITKLESVQRSFTSKIMGLQEMNYWERLRQLRLYSLQRRRERYTIIHLWKVYKGLSPNDLDLTFYEHQRLGPQCKRPKINGSAHTDTLKFNSFVSRGPALFNIIPKDVKCVKTDNPNCDEAQRFKNSLDKFLKKFPDTPPTPGYVAINGNSLLEWVTSRHTVLQGGDAETS